MMRLIFRLALLLVLSVPAQAADRIGVVLLHGKQGVPDALITNLAASLEGAGYIVERPEMCWSKRRLYDKPYLDCIAEIDVAVARLKSRGANAIVVAGQSLGGNAVLGYGARREGLAGIIVLAGAHAPERLGARSEIRDSLANAQRMIAAGKAENGDYFFDINGGAPFSVRTTARIYASFFGADSPGVMPANAAQLKAPLLWVAGDSDPTQAGAEAIFAKAPADPRNRYVTVAANHLGTPDAAKDEVLAWLRDLRER